MSEISNSRPATPSAEAELNRESWRVFQIMSEFVEGFEKLSRIRPAVSIFGSARTPVDHPWYAKAEEVARLLSEAGFSVISGGGPGIMEAANKGAFEGPSPSVGLNIVLPHEQAANPYQDLAITYRRFGTLDELAECLTLVQTGKGRRIPIILVERDFWQGMLEWFRSTLVAAGTIDETDLELMQLQSRGCCPQAVDQADETLEPEVTIRQSGDRTIHEYRINGRLYMIKIVPRKGPPYYLMDLDGDGEMDVTEEDPSKIVVPQWILFRW